MVNFTQIGGVIAIFTRNISIHKEEQPEIRGSMVIS
jgi:hypothetical protein